LHAEVKPSRTKAKGSCAEVKPSRIQSASGAAATDTVHHSSAVDCSPSIDFI
jgi:hypothetical protein